MRSSKCSAKIEKGYLYRLVHHNMNKTTMELVVTFFDQQEEARIIFTTCHDDLYGRAVLLIKSC